MMEGSSDSSLPKGASITNIKEDVHSHHQPSLVIEKDEGTKLQTDEQGFQESLDSVPKGYYYSPFFIGSFVAIGLGFWAGNSGFAYAAPILPIINADLGPDPNVQWVAYVHPVGLSIGVVSNGS